MSKLKDENGRPYYRDFFVYTATVGSLAAGASQTVQLSTDSNSGFVWEKSSFFATLAGAPLTEANRIIPLVNVTISDGGSARNLLNKPTPIATLAGIEGLPFNLSVPRVFGPQSIISIDFANFSAATDYDDLSLVFHGYKMIYR